MNLKFGLLIASSLTLFTGRATAANSSLPEITVKGNAFFDSSSGDRFYIRGVDYQPGGSSNLTDPLADEETCTRDVAAFKDLGINTVRVYTVDNTLDHSACMDMLAEAGIYLILDVNTPDSSISRFNPGCSYNAAYLQSVFATIDCFANYTNVLGFFAGNEVINNADNTNTATYVKAVVRDMKKYLRARGYRQIPVGYSAADVSSNRVLAANYFNCGDDADARIDMFGVNDYSWCGASSFQTSGYATKMQLYKNYSIPIFLSEFGCNEVPGSRPFTEIGSIYSTQMSSVFSGGLVYEYSNESNNYGLVDIDNSTSVTKLQDFENLKNQYAKVSDPTGNGGYSSSNNYSSCPSYQSGTWEANNTLPAMPSQASIFFSKGAGDPMGTGYPTQDMCDSDVDFNVTSASSSITSASSSSSSSAQTSSTAASSSSDNSTLTAPSTSATSSKKASSKSKGGAASLQVPLVIKLIANVLLF
ncbi:LAMI_0E01442g1_1 [Lachancea mirantina]|uniref:1,3-beta-glucanosyltransferase n=1 Tax=Lachancea mirantina TaxID=1230905 RepID=A0A1G4JIK7_9SACH|nr:LAMI_0E01442g1_1 [Lachancea mirantina]